MYVSLYCLIQHRVTVVYLRTSNSDFPARAHTQTTKTSSCQCRSRAYSGLLYWAVARFHEFVIYRLHVYLAALNTCCDGRLRVSAGQGGAFERCFYTSIALCSAGIHITTFLMLCISSLQVVMLILDRRVSHHAAPVIVELGDYSKRNCIVHRIGKCQKQNVT